MRILFVHQNFPGQFKHLAPALAADPANEVVALTIHTGPTFERVNIIPYKPTRGTAPNVHPWVADFETKVIRGEAAFRAARQLKEQGFTPDVILAHPGWGESLFLKQVWPDTPLAIYCEFFYHADGADVGFDPEFSSPDAGDRCRVEMKNINNFLHMRQVDAGISPTAWQASTFPEPFRSRITVIHDGIDTDLLVPKADIAVTLASGVRLTRADEVITFVNRNLEPYRGYHIFMRALPVILRRRPRARVMIVGGNNVSYGARPPEGQTWKEVFLAEASRNMDEAMRQRIHFLGNLPYAAFVSLLQLSTVHVYLTYPFVLSWSLLEAMSVGCAIVGSDTAPVREAIEHGQTGRLFNFFDQAGLAEAVCDLLEHPQERARLGLNARELARQRYDLKRVCLPRQLEWASGLLRA